MDDEDQSIAVMFGLKNVSENMKKKKKKKKKRGEEK